MSADADTFDEIEGIIRAYGNDKLVSVKEIKLIGNGLEPGRTNRFEAIILATPSDVDRYIVEFTVIR